jgi:hypothetical protein
VADREKLTRMRDNVEAGKESWTGEEIMWRQEGKAGQHKR